MLSNRLLNSYISSHWFMLLPTLAREVSSCSGWWLRQRHIVAQSAENRWLWMLSTQWDIYISNPPSPRLRELHRRWGRKNVRARGWEAGLWDAVLSHNMAFQYELIAAMVIKLVKISIIDGGGACEAPPRLEKLLAVDGLKGELLLGVWQWKLSVHPLMTPCLCVCGQL